MAEGNINEVLSSVFSNPELMEKINGIVKSKNGEKSEDALPDIISAINENIKIPTQSEEKSEAVNENTAEASTVFSRSAKDSAALLRAMKPFLSKERCEMVDNILKFEQLAALVKLTR